MLTVSKHGSNSLCTKPVFWPKSRCIIAKKDLAIDVSGWNSSKSTSLFVCNNGGILKSIHDETLSKEVR